MFNSHAKGFSLVELLITLTISITGITGLMRYHQTLIFQFSYAMERQQVWQMAHQLLEIYPNSSLTLPNNWQYQISSISPPSLIYTHSEALRCEMVKVLVTSPLNIQAELERLIC